MEFTPTVYFVTPVWQRFALTRACLRQRRDMIDELPFPAQAVIVGNDANLDVAREFGFDVVEMGNDFVSAKFNAGYVHAIGAGATHCMPIGSDSWLHPCAFEDVEWEAKKAYATVGLSSVSPYGDERLDLAVKYPAGFGVGMIYPEFALRSGRGASPDLNRGIDTSTWARCGRGRVKVDFLDVRPQAYVNFHSPDTQITDYKAIRSSYHRKAKTSEPWDDLRLSYGDSLVREVQMVYALHSLQVFFTGKRPTVERKKRPALKPGRVGRAPASKRTRPERPAIPYLASSRRTAMVENFDSLQGPRAE